MKQLPEGLPPLPPNSVYLGLGGSFTRLEDTFSGWLWRAERGAQWEYRDAIHGMDEDVYYAAPANSEIAKLNGLVPEVKEEEVASDVDKHEFRVKEFGDKKFVEASFAKKLQSQRDDARKEKDELKQELAACMKERDHWHQESMADAERLEQWKEVAKMFYLSLSLVDENEAIEAYEKLKKESES